MKGNNETRWTHRVSADPLWLSGVLVTLCLLSCSGDAPAIFPLPILEHRILADIKPQESRVSCLDTLTVDLARTTAGRFFFFLNESLQVDAVKENGRSISLVEIRGPELDKYLARVDERDTEFYANAAVQVIELPSGGGRVPQRGPRRLVVSYSGVIYDSLQVADYSRGSEAEQTTGLIDTAGVFLGPASHWYPSIPDSMAVFSVTALTPEGYESVTEGRLASRESGGGSVKAVWRGTHRCEGAYLIAGPYDVNTLPHGDVEIATYFYKSEADLSDQYLHASDRYVSMYEELLGPYPYAKFAVVENFFPTGYGMPSYTVLGRRVLRLPFIIYTSLGHEIAHNWWGNGVFIDPDGGNWCEGLTTYCADYRYKHQKGYEDAREYRRDINRDYTAYVTPENDMPLTEFTERTTPASRAIGYGKCAMVFHMLEQMMGEERFFETLRGIISKYMFKQIGWAEIEEGFSKAQGEDLGWFFSQWVKGTGAPLLRITKATATDEWTEYILSVRLVQEGGPFHLSVPVVVRTEKGRLWKTIEMDGPAADARIKCRAKPISVEVDPGHNLMRRMASGEIAPTLSRALGDKETIIVKPGGAAPEAAGAYNALAAQLSRTGEAQVVADSELTESQVASHSLFILGGAGENSALGMFPGKWPKTVFARVGEFKVQGTVYSSPEDCVLFVGRNPSNAEKTIVVLAGLSAAAVEACSRKVIHYGKYGYVVFKAGEAVDKGTWEIRDYPWMRVRVTDWG